MATTEVTAQVGGYSFAQSTATYSSIAATGTTVPFGTASWDDHVSTSAIPIGFTFKFNNVDYTDCRVGSNGFITFGTTLPATNSYTPLSATTGYGGAVSAVGCNLIRSSASDPVRYTVIGTAPNREFIVEWKDVRRRAFVIITYVTVSGDALNFQVRLKESTNEVSIHYGPTTITDANADIGVQVGLRGSSTAQFQNRSTTSNWSSTTAGGSNTATCSTNNTVKPVNGLLFTWTPPSCLVPQLVLGTPGGTSVGASWTCAGCTGQYILEYGPAGYIPGTGATAGAGGTLVSANATSPTTISGLTGITAYVAAIRQSCGSGQYSVNSTVAFTTGLDCANPPAVACSTPTSFTLSGSGNPSYPSSAPPCNESDPGQERLFKFTTTYPGINRINVTSHSGDFLGGFLSFVSYQIAPFASGCSLSGFTCLGSTIFPTSWDVTLPAGTYYLLVDVSRTEAVTETFNIQCAAPPACVASPTAPTNGATGLCQPVTLSWPAVSAFPSATGYDVYLNAGNANPTTLVSSNQPATTYAVSGLAAGTYSWKVVPRNASGPASGCTFWTFSVNPEPAGDRAATAITLPALPASVSGNIRAANCFNNDFTTSSIPGSANAKPGRDVFYKLTTSSCARTVTVRVCASSGGDSFIHLITSLGSSVANNDNAAPPGCTNANSSSLTNVAVLPNTTYLIVVEGLTAANEFDFTLAVSETTDPFDSDGDGTPDCSDGCPADPNKVDPGVCGCDVSDVDTDADGLSDCFDGCPNDPNKSEEGVCGCGVADVPVTWYADTDGDGFGDPAVSQEGYSCIQPPGHVLDNTDDCPSLSGRQGDSCNDGSPFTTGDVIDGTCTCVGTPVPAHNWTLRIVTDGAGGETRWEVRDVPTNYLLGSGGPYPNNSTVNQSVSIPDAGHFTLRVFDDGNNGIANGGGYLLTDHLGRRVIDNLGNGGGFASMSESPEGFFTPTGIDALRAIDCDNVERWPYDMVQCNANPLVSAQWDVGNQADDGYEFWFTDPNGSYSRHVFRSHAASGGYGPANAQRACKFGLASLVSDPLPQDMLLNVRVRGRVNGVNLDFGPACRLKVDQAAANCHTTQLENLPGANLSCGVTGLRTNGTSKLYAKPVTRYIRATNTYVAANRYRFHFVNVGESTSFDIVHPSYPLMIYPQMPFQLGATYSVTVQASFDGGATYCPVGPACEVSFATSNNRMEAVSAADTRVDELLLWPNPNRGDQLYLRMDELESPDGKATVDVVNMFGERVMGTTVVLNGGGLNTSIELDKQLANGLYLVDLTVGGRTITQRLVVQR